jgi:hypothetical protein
MHRSGTSMLTRILKEAGLFIGHKLLPFKLYESAYFVALNEWLLQQANASWDNTYNYQFTDEIFMAQAREAIIRELKGKRKKDFLGRHKVKDIRDLDVPWGWKDPRTTITIDLWKSVFPDARILHIYRNPVDVAVSLSKREAEIRLSKKLVYTLKIMRFLDYKATQNLSLRVMHPEEGIKLWEEYVSKAFSLDDKYAGDVYHLRYEDFLDDPMAFLPAVADFAGIAASGEELKGLVKQINPDRKYAFKDDAALVKLYRSIRDNALVQRAGYGQIVE